MGDEEVKEDVLEEAEEREFFSPINGNVAFICALDHWGFTIPDFSKILAKKLKIHPKKLA